MFNLPLCLQHLEFCSVMSLNSTTATDSNIHIAEIQVSSLKSGNTEFLHHIHLN